MLYYFGLLESIQVADDVSCGGSVVQVHYTDRQIRWQTVPHKRREEDVAKEGSYHHAEKVQRACSDPEYLPLCYQIDPTMNIDGHDTLLISR